jgi:lauroyl/myristoyl acyltransferase
MARDGPRASLYGWSPVTGPHVVRSPSRRDPVPPAPWRLRLHASPWPRRLVPAGIAARAGGLRRRGAREALAEARETIAALVAGTDRAHELEALARRRVAEQRLLEEMFWRPWTLRPRRVVGRVHLEDALASGRGLLFSGMHQGPCFAPGALLGERAADSFLVTTPWRFEAPGPTLWGVRLAQWWRIAARYPQALVDAEGSAGFLAEVLRGGGIVFNAFDMPGRERTPMLGKPIDLSSSNARLARLSDALVVPLTFDRDRGRALPIVAAPLDPREHPDHRALHLALAAVHERWLLDRPEAAESPRRAGAWEERATAEGWLVEP